jgi:cob(I)alamin adenosyltransferase
MAKIYTKTGDNGTTGIIGGTRISKASLRIECYGTVDELNSYIGLVRDVLDTERAREILKEIQDRLFTIGSSLACDPDKEPKMKIPDLKVEDIELLEKEMDFMQSHIPPMKFFILPGGHVNVSYMHVARCVCRRAERLCVALQDEGLFVEPLIIKYINRLSDYLFMLCRYSLHLWGIEEVPWKPRV